MKYNELTIEASKNKKRVGRGIAAGGGKTAGRGTKGQNSRTGKKLNATFQGGQRTLVRAVPKARGFKSLRTPAQVVYLDTLNGFTGKTVDANSLYEAGYISTPFHTVKIITRGELTKALTVKVSGARFQGRKIPRNKSITRVWVNNIPAQINNARFKKIPENSTKIPR